MVWQQRPVYPPHEYPAWKYCIVRCLTRPQLHRAAMSQEVQHPDGSMTPESGAAQCGHCLPFFDTTVTAANERADAPTCGQLAAMTSHASDLPNSRSVRPGAATPLASDPAASCQCTRGTLNCMVLLGTLEAPCTVTFPAYAVGLVGNCTFTERFHACTPGRVVHDPSGEPLLPPLEHTRTDEDASKPAPEISSVEPGSVGPDTS